MAALVLPVDRGEVPRDRRRRVATDPGRHLRSSLGRQEVRDLLGRPRRGAHASDVSPRTATTLWSSPPRGTDSESSVCGVEVAVGRHANRTRGLATREIRSTSLQQSHRAAHLRFQARRIRPLKTSAHSGINCMSIASTKNTELAAPRSKRADVMRGPTVNARAFTEFWYP